MTERAITEYGFQFGAARVERLAKGELPGSVLIGVKTPKAELTIYVTKTGKVRVFDRNGGEWRQLEVPPCPTSDQPSESSPPS